MIHSGMVPRTETVARRGGAGLAEVPGEQIQSVTVLHYMRVGSPSEQFNTVGRARCSAPC